VCCFGYATILEAFKEFDAVWDARQFMGRGGSGKRQAYAVFMLQAVKHLKAIRQSNKIALSPLY
jgi:hypothetical protein